MMRSRHRLYIKKKRFLKVIFIALIFGFVFLLWKGFPPLFVKRFILNISSPIFYLENKISHSLRSKFFILKSKEALFKENLLLKEEILKYKSKDNYFRILLDENKKLRAVLDSNSEKHLILAPVLSRPGYGIYNSLIIGAGSKRGVFEKMKVTAFGNVFLGYVDEVGLKTSRVKLISFPNQKTNVYIDNKIAAIASGLGGENLEIVLPSDLKIKVGDYISTLEEPVLFLGIVERIEKSPSNPFQRILFRLPLNINQLKYVFLIKND